jgi:hypothetical protein
MMQIFPIQLRWDTASASVEIYGYIATRDTRDSLRNYTYLIGVGVIPSYMLLTQISQMHGHISI